MQSADAVDTVSQQLLLSVAEQLKLPFLQIARQAEWAAQGVKPDYGQIKTLADNALQLLDGYSISLQLSRLYNYDLSTEAVSIASVLFEANQQLSSLARMYDVQLELNIAGKFGPVLAHKRGLLSALVGLGSALIEAIPAQGEIDRPTVQLATHRCRYGIVAGVYASIPGLNSEALTRGRRLLGKSRQPLVDISPNNGSGIFVADAIFRSMKLKMHVSRHHRLYGLGVVLQPSSQLALI